MEHIDHIDLVVSDLDRSLAFYTELLRPLGFSDTSEITGERGERVVYLDRPGHRGQIGLRESQTEGAPDRYGIGLHHLAFTAPTREAVDERAQWLKGNGHVIESGPADYDYSPDYYAVFFSDPDGLKLELVHRSL